MAKLRHARIAEVLDVDFTGDTPWIVMRYVPGQTLAASRGRDGAPFADGDGRLSSASLRWFEELARTLHAAHRAGVVHADLHPNNLLIASDGGPVVVDFGVARIFDMPTAERAVEPRGSARYMAPEVARGGRADARSDVYSLAAIVAECAVATPGTDPAHDVAAVADPSLQAVLRAALQARPAARTASAADLADELRRLRLGLPVRARSIGALRRVALSVAAHPLPWTLAFGLLFTVATAILQLGTAVDRRERAIAAAANSARLLLAMAEPAGDSATLGVESNATADPSNGAADIPVLLAHNLRRAGRAAEALEQLDHSPRAAVTASGMLERALAAYELDRPLPEAVDHGPESSFVRALATWRAGSIPAALRELSEATTRTPWQDASMQAEAAAFAAWIAGDEHDLEAATAMTAVVLEHMPTSPIAALLKHRIGTAGTETMLDVVSRCSEWAGPDHPWTLRAERWLAAVLAEAPATDRLGALRSSGQLLESLTERQRRLHGPGHPEVLRTMLLHRDLRLQAYGIDGADAIQQALENAPDSATKRRLLRQPRPIDTGASRESTSTAAANEEVVADYEAARALEPIFWNLADILGAHVPGAIGEHAVDRAHAAFARAVLWPARTRRARVLHGRTSREHILAIVEHSKACLAKEITADALRQARLAALIAADAGPELDQGVRDAARAMLLLANVNARRQEPPPDRRATGLTPFEPWLTELADLEQRARGRLEDPAARITIELAADAWAMAGGSWLDAAESAYSRLVPFDESRWQAAHWAADCALRAGKAAVAARWLHLGGQGLAFDRLPSTDWRRTYRERLLQGLQALQRAATEHSEQVGR